MPNQKERLLEGKTVVVVGASGLVGSRFVELYGGGNFVTPSDKELDLVDEKSMSNFVEQYKPDIVVNFAALTDVDACETERENKNGIVWKVNAEAPKLLSRLSRENNFFMIQISTDMVFPGSKNDPGPYKEAHAMGSPDNLTWYGASKAKGEQYVLEENPDNAVVRIIYPVRASFPPKLDYARKILKLYDDGRLYPMFTDQFMNITFIDELATALKIIINNKISGTHHVAASDTTTPYEFASYLIEKTRSVAGVVQENSFEKFIEDKDNRRYPQFGGLKCESTEARFGLEFSTWKEIVDKLTISLQLS